MQTHENKSGEVHDYSSEFLMTNESGSRIDLDMLDFSDIKCPHTKSTRTKMIFDLNAIEQHAGVKITGAIHVGAGESLSQYRALGLTNTILFEPQKKY